MNIYIIYNIYKYNIHNFYKKVAFHTNTYRMQKTEPFYLL